MKYKTLIIDLDGTTVPQGSSEPPSKKVSHAIAKAKEKIHVCIATSRPFYMAKNIIEHLELSGPCILSAGTQIYDPQKKRMVKEYPLKSHLVSPIINVFKKYPYEIILYNGIDDGPYPWKTRGGSVFSLWVSEVTAMDVAKIEKELKKITGIAVHRMPAVKDFSLSVLEITNGQATKLHGIEEVMKILRIQKEEIIGVGDSYNDFPLLMASGLKIAMGNAIPELKAIADFIAPSVEEDGVATVIEKFILAA